MSQIFDIYNLLILALAIAILLRLRSVLGRRTGNERRPFDPYSLGRRPNGSAEVSRESASHDKVVTLPRPATAQREPVAASPADLEARFGGIAAPGTPLFDKLSAAVAADPGFDPKGFLTGANAAYEMIVSAFANGDRSALRPLLSDDVYAGFDAAITGREQQGETMTSTLIGIDKAEITDAVRKGDVLQITVHFQSQMITATHDRGGKVVDGDPHKVSEVGDVWTFARDVRSPDPNWKLVATETV